LSALSGAMSSASNSLTMAVYLTANLQWQVMNCNS
jgi:hypothetical protein